MLASCLTLQRSPCLRLDRLSIVKTVSLASISYQNRTKMRQKRDFHHNCLCYMNHNLLGNQKSLPTHLTNGVRTLADGNRNRRRRKRGQYSKFEDLANLHQRSKLGLERAGLTRMTEIQSKTWEHALQGRDILARARTGTGKTMVRECGTPCLCIVPPSKI